MLFFEHVLIAVGVGAAMLVVIEIAQRSENYGLHRVYALFIGLVWGQFIDVDHYTNSVKLLADCAMSSCHSDFTDGGMCVALHRGLFHHSLVFSTLLFLLGGLAILAYRRDRKIMSTLFMGIFLGYISHLVADGILP